MDEELNIENEILVIKKNIDDNFNVKKLKKELIKESLSFAAVIFTLLAAFSGIILAVVSFTDIIPKEDTVIDKYLEIAVTTFIILLIFSLFYFFFIVRISKNLSTNYIGFNKVVDLFLVLAKKLNSQNKTNISLSENIKNAPVSNLITWGSAGQIEIDAKKVWAISYSLKWLSKIRINQILQELVKYPDHEYHFILVRNDIIERNAIYTNINNKILDYDRINNTNLKARFIIKKTNSENLMFPMPNDIAIYQSFIEGDTEQSIVVINSHEFSDNNESHEIKKEELDTKFDIRFTDPIQVSRLVIWYEKFWQQDDIFEND